MVIGCLIIALLETFLLIVPLASGQPSNVEAPSSWKNTPSFDFVTWESNGMRPILVNGDFLCGFYCNLVGEFRCLFAVGINGTVIWSANRNHPIQLEAKLQFSQEGGLVLQDGATGDLVWSTKSAGKYVSRLNLTDEGNLVLFSQNNSVVWQSFEHPTDCLVLGQRLVSGQKLRASVSASNWSEGRFSFAIDQNGSFIAFTESNPPVVYFRSTTLESRSRTGEYYAEFKNQKFGSLNWSGNLIKLGIDGSLKTYVLKKSYLEYGAIVFDSASINRAEGPTMGNPPPGKVDDKPTNRTNTKNTKVQTAILLASTLGVLSLLLILLAGSFLLRGKRNNSSSDVKKKNRVKTRFVGFTRFTYDELTAMTDNFSRKLGEGGFGSVFDGMLPNSNAIKIAVKNLVGVDHIRRSFLAELQSLVNVHHVNLVMLLGYCAEKSHSLLVYEYMCNGSLDKWIFPRDRKCTLNWKLRQKIINDVAQGLAYLHDGCNQKILHLDIKPQNILLDEDFTAKLGDFGLSKLINRDQTQVVTAMRGTPGYMAPEWSSSTITEKVDVYSFGIVMLEILCGRKNVDRSLPEEEMHLLRLFEKKLERGEVLDLVDKHSEDMQSNSAEVVKMMRVAAWCLQADYSRRPSMLEVLKVLEGFEDVEDDLTYSFLNHQAAKAALRHKQGTAITTPALPSELSAPR